MTHLNILDPAHFRKLNSATKYPPILTYHEMGAKGRLNPTVQVPFEESHDIVVTEKIDGTNARIIVFPDGDYIIGSREEFLYARGDRIPNSSLGIVEVARPVAERLREATHDRVTRAYYGEVYGLGIGKSGKQYSKGHRAFRLFDVALYADATLNNLIADELKTISLWRQAGCQTFFSEEQLQSVSKTFDVPLTPRLHINTRPCPPESIEYTMTWLQSWIPDGQSEATLEGGVVGNPEGLVVRTADRGTIAKLRFEDYIRTLR